MSSININISENDNLVVPIMFHGTSSNLHVMLYLNKFEIERETGDHQYLYDPTGRHEIELKRRQEFAGVFSYGKILDNTVLTKKGTYTGFITVRKIGEDEILELVPVNISITSNPLHLTTDFDAPGQESNLTYAAIISALYNHLYIAPRYTKLDLNGKLTVTYSRKRDNDVIHLFRSKDNGLLPLGSTYTVINKETQNPVMEKCHILNTDKKGRDMITGDQLTDDYCEASFAYISDIPDGTYIIFAEYIDGGTLCQTPYNEFTIS